MTISSRRRFYWALFLLAALALAASAYLAFPLLLGTADTGFLDSSGAMGESRLFGLRVPSTASVAGGLVLSSLLAVLGLALVLSFFRKTVSPEIFFFSFWLLSIGLEACRLVVFRMASGGLSLPWIMLGTRVALGARYAGYLSLFAAGLYAAGFRNEKLGSVMLVVLAIGAGLASAMPLNTGVYERGFLLKPGYEEISAALSWLAGGVTALNFLYAAHSTGEKSYRVAALGVAAFVFGRRLLLVATNPPLVLLGAALLAAGTWLFVSRLHAYYLWQ